MNAEQIHTRLKRRFDEIRKETMDAMALEISAACQGKTQGQKTQKQKEVLELVESAIVESSKVFFVALNRHSDSLLTLLAEEIAIGFQND